jgi:hypothetical protein
MANIRELHNRRKSKNNKEKLPIQHFDTSNIALRTKHGIEVRLLDNYTDKRILRILKNIAGFKKQRLTRQTAIKAIDFFYNKGKSVYIQDENKVLIIVSNEPNPIDHIDFEVLDLSSLSTILNYKESKLIRMCIYHLWQMGVSTINETYTYDCLDGQLDQAYSELKHFAKNNKDDEDYKEKLIELSKDYHRIKKMWLEESKLFAIPKIPCTIEELLAESEKQVIPQLKYWAECIYNARARDSNFMFVCIAGIYDDALPISDSIVMYYNPKHVSPIISTIEDHVSHLAPATVANGMVYTEYGSRNSIIDNNIFSLLSQKNFENICQLVKDLYQK